MTNYGMAISVSQGASSSARWSASRRRWRRISGVWRGRRNERYRVGAETYRGRSGGGWRDAPMSLRASGNPRRHFRRSSHARGESRLWPAEPRTPAPHPRGAGGRRVEVIRRAAERTLLEHCGDTVRLRGLIEFSNRCIARLPLLRHPAQQSCADALYAAAGRDRETARWCAEQGLWLGRPAIGRTARCALSASSRIRYGRSRSRRSRTRCHRALGITLCVEHRPKPRRMVRCGAHRYRCAWRRRRRVCLPRCIRLVSADSPSIA